MSDTVTLRELREITGEAAHVLNHALDRHGPAPAGRIGLIRYWNRADLDKILASLAKTAAHRNSSGRQRAPSQAQSSVEE